MKQGKISKVFSKRKIPAWVAISLFLILMFVFSGVFISLFGIIDELMRGYGGKETEMMTGIRGGVAMLCATFISSFILFYWEGRGFSELGLSLKGRMPDILYGALMAVGIYAVGFGVSLLLGVVEITEIHLDWKSLLEMWFFFLLVAFYEELSFRGYILGRLLCTGLNKFLAVSVSSFLFALMHIFNPNIALLPMINLVLAGILLGTTYLYTRNLWFPIALHLFWNWIQGPVLGYQVSGNEIGKVTLFTLRLPENNLINGGTFGFEGSLTCTVLLVITTLLIVWQCEKKEELRKCIGNPSQL